MKSSCDGHVLPGLLNSMLTALFLLGASVSSGRAVAAPVYERKVEPPSRDFHITHYRVSLRFTDAGIAAHSFEGNVALTVDVLRPDLASLTLDSEGLQINQVTLADGANL